MGKLLRSLFLLFTICLFFANCRKKQWEEFYGRPDNLEPPIYQVLESKGNFTSLLACIDKAGYKNILGSAGYWTMFAPTNEAFNQFFKEQNISGIEALDSLTAQKIVRFCLVYNSFNQERLDDYQASSGWTPDNAFRRRTAYYELFDTATVNGQTIHIVASNRNNSGNNNGYTPADNNNKYITYFTNPFFAKGKLSAADYNYFYSTSSFSGMNIMDARIVEADIPSENGTIHVIDKVLMPVPNIDKYLASKPEYSLFKSLFDRFLVTYVENAEATQRYQVLYGASENVSVKLYDAGLAFSLNNENYLKAQDNDGQENNWTIFAPTNDVLETYLKNVLLEHYDNDLNNLEKLPTQTILDFVNGHMWQTPVWPSRFATTGNFLGEEARFDAHTDITDKKILSNGFFYGAHKVQDGNYFSTVYARPYLDPKYSMMTRLLNNELKPVISNPNFRYTIIMMSDKQIHDLGFDWDGNRSSWINTKPGVLGSGDPRGTLLRLINMHVIATPNHELDNLTGEGIVETFGGEMIKFQNNQLYAAGNIDSSRNLSILDTRTMKNGIVYYTDGLLYFSAKSVGKQLEELSADSTSPYFNFFQYLKNSTMYTAATGAIKDVPLGFFGTFLIPDNNAIKEAVNAGLLPGKGTAPDMDPNFNPTDLPGKDQVEKFIRYHILKKTVIHNGKTDGNIESLYRSLDDQIGYVEITNKPGSFQFTDAWGRTATIDAANSNVLADRVVFHSINTYLKYND